MGPTTSRPSPAKGKPEQSRPIRGIKLKVTLSGAAPDQLADLARESGLEVAKSGGRLTVGFQAATTQEALERLKVLTALLAPKP